MTKQVTVSLSGQTGAGKTLLSEVLLAILRQHGLKVIMQHNIGAAAVSAESVAQIMQTLREADTEVVLVDYRT